MELVGRDVELGVLRDALAEARRGRGRLVLVAGAAGMGKTGLVTAFADEAAGRGATVLEGASWEAGGAPAYWPWTQVLRGLVRVRGADTVRSLAGADLPWLAHLLPELGPPGPIPPGASEGSRFAFVDAVSGVLLRAAADTPPLVVLLDDLHAAGGPAGRLLLFLARQIRAAPMLLVGAYRPVEAGWDPEVGEVVAGLEAAGTGVRLAPLDPAAVAALIARTLGRAPGGHLAATIVDRTGGNPLFVTQVGRLLASGAGAGSEDGPSRRASARPSAPGSPGCPGWPGRSAPPRCSAASSTSPHWRPSRRHRRPTCSSHWPRPRRPSWSSRCPVAGTGSPTTSSARPSTATCPRKRAPGCTPPSPRCSPPARATTPSTWPCSPTTRSRPCPSSIPRWLPTTPNPPRGRPRGWARTSGLRSCTPVPSPRWSTGAPPTYRDAAGSRSRSATRSSGVATHHAPATSWPRLQPSPAGSTTPPACPGRARAHRAPGLQRHRRRRARAAR